MEQLTNASIKLIHQLDRARERRESGLFKVEGTKAVIDTMGSFKLHGLYATPEWLEKHPLPRAVRAIVTRQRDLARMSSLSTPAEVIAVYHLPAAMSFDSSTPDNELVLALDAIQDPGNLGTIIRTADWWGITTILAGSGTADCFAPKVVQSTMGAISRVKVIYCDLCETLSRVKAPVYGTFLDGDDIYSTPLSPYGVIVMGNEGRGISPEVGQWVGKRLHIPPYPNGRPTSESLNAAVATAVTISEFRRRK